MGDDVRDLHLLLDWYSDLPQVNQCDGDDMLEWYPPKGPSSIGASSRDSRIDRGLSHVGRFSPCFVLHSSGSLVSVNQVTSSSQNHNIGGFLDKATQNNQSWGRYHVFEVVGIEGDYLS
jgi:hypothetical protein